MARVIKKYYDDILPLDEYGIYSRKPNLIELEEKGVIYHYYPDKPSECSVSYIAAGIEEVIIADEITVEGKKSPVVRWGIPLVDINCTKGIKTLVLGKNLREYNELTLSDLVSLKKLIIPESIEKFPPIGCVNLKEISLSEKYQIDLDKYIWSHPKLEKITLLNNGETKIISAEEIGIKRKKMQIIKDAENAEKIAEEKRIAKQEKLEKKCSNVRQYYFMVVCAIPYVWAFVLLVKSINFDLDIWTIVAHLYIAGVVLCAFVCAYSFAVVSSDWLSEKPTHLVYKNILAFFAPLFGVSVSWIALSILFNFMTLVTSCHAYGIIDPRTF
jgi:hypothetical protein